MTEFDLADSWIDVGFEVVSTKNNTEDSKPRDWKVDFDLNSLKMHPFLLMWSAAILPCKG